MLTGQLLEVGARDVASQAKTQATSDGNCKGDGDCSGLIYCIPEQGTAKCINNHCCCSGGGEF